LPARHRYGKREGQKSRLRLGAEAETSPVHRGLRKSDGSAMPTDQHLKLRATNHQNQTSGGSDVRQHKSTPNVGRKHRDWGQIKPRLVAESVES